jgi:hypothetical protein
MSENNPNDLTITKSPNGKREKITSYDTLAVIRYLEEKVRGGECLGIAFVGIGKEGQCIQGYTGAAIEQPFVTVGMMSFLQNDILKNNRERNNPTPLE